MQIYIMTQENVMKHKQKLESSNNENVIEFFAYLLDPCKNYGIYAILYIFFEGTLVFSYLKNELLRNIRMRQQIVSKILSIDTRVDAHGH